MQIIKYADIQLGDTIRVNYPSGNFKQGRIIHIGRVGIETAESSADNDSYFLERYADEAIYLIDRPKPPLPTKVGTIFTATKIDGRVGKWNILVGYPMHTLDKNIYQVQQDRSRCAWVEAKHIQEWEPIK